MGDTSIDTEKINAIADKIAGVMGDHLTACEALSDFWPNAGTFSTAQWLERVVDDRRNAIVEHAHRLDSICKNMGQSLKTMATDLSETDKGNAAAMNDFTAMKNKIDGDVLKTDQDLENKQHNFSPDGEGAVNPGDGDGYDDNLTVDVGDNPDPTYDDKS